MQKIVLDTNVLISAIVFGGKPRKVLESTLKGEMRLCLSEPLLEELQGVLQGPKFRFPRAVIQEIVNELVSVAEIVIPTMKITRIVDDPDDNRILECAVEAKAALIVSGDPHLLNVQEFQGIEICSPAGFVKEFLDR